MIVECRADNADYTTGLRYRGIGASFPGKHNLRITTVRRISGGPGNKGIPIVIGSDGSVEIIRRAALVEKAAL